jgi:ABC-type bacteriocin/lantibiotic exporter with double-glycine peptidase domain
MQEKTIIILLKDLWIHIEDRHRKLLIILIFVMFFSALSEIVSIGIILPLLTILANPEDIFTLLAEYPILNFIQPSNADQLLLPIVILFCGAAVISGFMRVLLLWMNTRLSSKIVLNLSANIYKKFLHQPFEVYSSKNSSTIIAGISSKMDIIGSSVIFSTVNLISSIVMLITILLVLFLINFYLTLSVFGIFGVAYGVIILATKRKLSINSKRIAEEKTKVVEALQEGVGGIRDILLDGSQEVYCALFQKADINLRNALVFNQIISNCPRFIMESLGLIVLALLILILKHNNTSIAEIITIVGVLALAAQKLLPLIQQGFAAWSGIHGSREVLVEILEYLNQKIPKISNKSKYLPFKSDITLQNVYFSFNLTNSNVIKKCNIRIQKGSHIGIVGKSGSGKSTILDIIMGLLIPTSGFLKIDGNSINDQNRLLWQAHVANVPQEIFLSDSSIAENIAFGKSSLNIDFDRIEEVSKKAQLHDFIQSLPEKYLTRVGERGALLSGGQRQRIGIARALYKKADVIILDEATSALDRNTESLLIDMIEELSEEITIIMVSHRLSTLKKCDFIYKVSDGLISSPMKYEQFIRRKFP